MSVIHSQSTVSFMNINKAYRCCYNEAGVRLEIHVLHSSNLPDLIDTLSADGQ